jgi:hypothetical protein
MKTLIEFVVVEINKHKTKFITTGVYTYDYDKFIEKQKNVSKLRNRYLHSLMIIDPNTNKYIKTIYFELL